MIAAMLAAAATAAPYPYTVTLAGGVDGLAAPPSAGGGVDGRAWIAGPRVGLEVGAREVLATAAPRTVGAIFAGARVALGDGPLFARVAFAHHHETPIAVLEAQPVAAVAGTAAGIDHRTGAEVGLAVASPLGWTGPLWERLGVDGDLGVAATGGDGGFGVSVFAGVRLTVGVGPAR